MATHVALLRGINVGRHGRLAMADLRAVATSLGWTDVATFIQSGNLVFSAPPGNGLAVQLEQVVAAQAGVEPGVVVLTREELGAVVAADPYADEPDPRRVHAVVVRGPLGLGLDENAEARVAQAVERARAKGSRDDARVVGGTLWLHTPDGIGRSDLATVLTRPRTDDVGTARNRATMHRLAAMLG